MPRKLKVWGGSFDGRNRHLVAAHTKKQAMELIGKTKYHNLSIYGFNGWWSQAGNKKELEVCNRPGVWELKDQHGAKPTFSLLYEEKQ